MSILNCDSSHLASVSRKERNQLLDGFSPAIKQDLKEKSLKKLAQIISGWELPIQRMALGKLAKIDFEEFKQVKGFLLQIEIENLKINKRKGNEDSDK